MIVRSEGAPGDASPYAAPVHLGRTLSSKQIVANAAAWAVTGPVVMMGLPVAVPVAQSMQRPMVVQAEVVVS